MNVFQLQDGTLKFFKYDTKEKALLIYNIDNTLWKSINLNVTKGHTIDDINILEVTSGEKQNQFNILYTCYYPETQPIEDVTNYLAKETCTVNVINEKGEFLLKIPRAGEYKLLTDHGDNKLIVYKTDRKGFKSKRQLEVYSF